MFDWVYASSGRKPKNGEYVLCDLGKNFSYEVFYYENDCFYDRNIGEYYNLGYDVKRWCSLPKHCDEEF